jgi:hypothetical protein
MYALSDDDSLFDALLLLLLLFVDVLTGLSRW